MKARHLTLRALPLCFAILAAPSVAQTRIHYESKGELVGAAAVGPYATEKMLQAVVDYCATLGSKAVLPATTALQGWQKRNATYLFLSGYYRKEIEKVIAAKPEAPEMQVLEKIIGPDTEELIKANADALLLAFRKAQEADPRDGGANMCRNYFRGIDDGSADLKNRDPELAAFLDRNPMDNRQASGTKQPK